MLAKTYGIIGQLIPIQTISIFILHLHQFSSERDSFALEFHLKHTIMIFTFDKEGIEKANTIFQNNNNFIYTAFPRIKCLYAIKKAIKAIPNLEWMLEFDHVNVHQNKIIIRYNHNKSEDFAFSYEIPLSQKFELRVFLSKSSVHFIDIYNFLIEREIISKNQFILKAEYHTIPHFILNKTNRYDFGILKQHTDSIELHLDLIDENIKKELHNSFSIFNPIFNEILGNFKI